MHFSQIELKKGTGVWVDAIKLEKIIGQAEITKKPPHQTLVKSLLTHLLGIEKYIDTSAEKINRRLLSAVVGKHHAYAFHEFFLIKIVILCISKNFRLHQ